MARYRVHFIESCRATAYRRGTAEVEADNPAEAERLVEGGECEDIDYDSLDPEPTGGWEGFDAVETERLDPEGEPDEDCDPDPPVVRAQVCPECGQPGGIHTLGCPALAR